MIGMPLGENPFSVVGQLGFMFDAHKVAVQLNPSKADVAVPRDKFGKPLQLPTPQSVYIVVSKAAEDIKPTEAGGKPIEVLEFYALTGTVNENDEISWNGHSFRISCVWPFGLGGMNQLVSGKAEREVDL